MATRKRKMCGYVDHETWQRFRLGCLQRQTSASKQLESLVTKQVDAWALDDLGRTTPVSVWQCEQHDPPEAMGG